MSTWKKLAEIVETHILPEERMYRGETNVRLKDLESLFAAIKAGDPKAKVPYSDDPALAGGPSPEGGAIDASFPVDPRVWSRWSRSPNYASIMSSTGDEQHPGAPRGGTVMKRAQGGRVYYEPGPGSTSHERMPSAQDRYDVMMVGDVQGAAIPATGAVTFASRGPAPASIVVQRIAWSPAIGSTEERQSRLKSLLAGGQAGPLRRRPQGRTPEPPRDTEGPPPEDVPRQGGAGRLGMGGFPQGKKSRED